MALKIRRTVVPVELNEAVAAHAAATVVNDAAEASRYIDARAAEAVAAALGRAGALRPFIRYEVLARARLGFHYLVKVKFIGRSGDLILQNRWSRTANGDWRLIECDDLGVKSPWKKPDKPIVVNADA
ncbi:hypothetical protein IMX07_11365 [bacterium]|nr:hypothetical protein [bacterium]